MAMSCRSNEKAWDKALLRKSCACVLQCNDDERKASSRWGGRKGARTRGARFTDLPECFVRRPSVTPGGNKVSLKGPGPLLHATGWNAVGGWPALRVVGAAALLRRVLALGSELGRAGGCESGEKRGRRAFSGWHHICQVRTFPGQPQESSLIASSLKPTDRFRHHTETYSRYGVKTT